MGWSYSSLYKSLAGAAIFDLPRSTARIHDPAVATFLEEVVAGRRDIETVADEFDTEAHRRFAGPADVVALCAAFDSRRRRGFAPLLETLTPIGRRGTV